MQNLDLDTVRGFGKEWTRFNQSALKNKELTTIFNDYFHIFPWDKLTPDANGMDVGCGSGRWASLVATNVGKLYCIDASSEALNIAKKNLKSFTNLEFISTSVDAIPLADDSLDFAYSLGVLHHIPDTFAGIKSCVKKLKPGAPFLVYLYYALDNKPFWYRALWKFSDSLRKIISHSPFFIKYSFSQCMALLCYFPLARLALLFEKLGINVNNFPLSAYRKRSLYVMRTDSLDRFGTRLEHRYSKAQINEMMASAGLENISFSDRVPYWCAVGYKK